MTAHNVLCMSQELSDKELLELEHYEAKESLDDDQLERYNELKKKSHQDNIEETKKQESVQDLEGLHSIVSNRTKDSYREVPMTSDKSIRINADFDVDDIQKFKEYKEFAERFEDMDEDQVDELDQEKIEEIKDQLYDVLGYFSVDYTKEDWIDAFENNPQLDEQSKPGLLRLQDILMNVFTVVEEEMEKFKQKKMT